jgi:hypothetical protein
MQDGRLQAISASLKAERIVTEMPPVYQDDQGWTA